QRLLHDLPDASVIVRLGGDEFVLVFEGARADRELGDIAERIISATATPIDWGDIRLKVGASIGIARSDRADNHVATILSDADFAMYDA
ncbi:diguanylate cyclase, partial [Acinetobacter baumannii]